MLNSDESLVVLKTASEARTVAESAPLDMEMKQIAYTINSAAATGQFEAYYNHNISAEALEQLESNGYQVVVTDRASLGDENVAQQSLIIWK